ncbi:MAG TPA: COX15/CtaA family protein [Haliangiales bacterium]|nr:COX15/CtaA family protein [Haliangiales bacterium]
MKQILPTLAVATAVATYVLLAVGGLVNPTGSSLACPDWPLCHGQVFPRMEGGVLFEHTHRLVAAAVGLATVALAIGLFSIRRGKLGLLAVGMVVLQGALGGLTVVLKLPPEISIGHLALSQLFFLTTIYIATVVVAPTPAPVPAGARRSVQIAAALVLAQVVLGGVVRHLHAAFACLDEVPLCFGSVWPTHHWLATLHMSHRLVAVLVAAAVIVAAVRVLGGGARGAARGLAAAAIALVAVQIGLGIWTVLSWKGLVAVEAHLIGGATLLADMWLLVLLTRPVPVAAARPAMAQRPSAGERLRDVERGTAERLGAASPREGATQP